MKNIVLFFLVAVLATSCNAQESESSSSEIAKSTIKKDSTNQPNERWHVNKEVDEHGNVIRYDSVYTWSSNGAVKAYNPDSLLTQMRKRMQGHFSMFQGLGHFGFSEQDSIFKQFFSDDFFTSPMAPNFPNMDDMIRQMEAMRDQFFNNRQRYIIPPESKSKTSKPMEKKQI
jgi:glutamate synthase domain-containing protein 2